eukprot:2041352-Alexandrium_andersonii.AAC.1
MRAGVRVCVWCVASQPRMRTTLRAPPTRRALGTAARTWCLLARVRVAHLVSPLGVGAGCVAVAAPFSHFALCSAPAAHIRA